MSQSYDINSYFCAGKTIYWAKYVDKKENGGNGNNKVDGNEISLFKDIMAHRYNNYQYDFNKKDSKQSLELNDENSKWNKDTYVAKELYQKNTEMKLSTGAGKLGYYVSKLLNNFTRENDYKEINKILHKINTFPVKAQKYNVIKSFLTDYKMGRATNGLFEQMGSEYYSKITNGDATSFLKTIIDNVPEEKRNTKEFQTLTDAYYLYNNKNSTWVFDNNDSYTKQIFGNDILDNLDEAIDKLYDIED